MFQIIQENWPWCVALLLFLILAVVFGWIGDNTKKPAHRVAAIVSFLVGLGCFWPVYQNETKKIDGFKAKAAYHQSMTDSYESKIKESTPPARKIPIRPVRPDKMPDGSPRNGWYGTLNGQRMVVGVNRSSDEFQLYLTTPDEKTTFEFNGREQYAPSSNSALKSYSDLKVCRIDGEVVKSSEGIRIGKFTLEDQAWVTGYGQDLVGDVPGVGKVRLIVP